MMDHLLLRCQKQLAAFRIKELKDVLAQMGSTKQGKKQDLLNKIMAVLTSETVSRSHRGFKVVGPSSKYATTKEEVAKTIDDIYRKMHRMDCADDLASKGKSGLPHSDDYEGMGHWVHTKTRCPCGRSVHAGAMIQCNDTNCGVWQHRKCVIIPEKEGLQSEHSSPFYCELCRVQRGDPFCVSLDHPLLPTMVTTSLNTSDGSNPLQIVEKTFHLSCDDQETLRKPNHDIQVWCILLDDKVPFRMHWPAFPDLCINGHKLRVISRPDQQLLGANGRDDGAGIAAYTREGTNLISFSANDARPFCVGIRIICRLNVQQVLQIVPSQSKGESFHAALARVSRCIGGGGLENGDDSDSDLEIVSDSMTVDLRCPISGSRIKIAGRFKPCLHIRGFDLHAFVELNQRSRKWQCPVCLKNYSIENLIIDPFLNVITTVMKNYDEDITEVEIKPGGYWRPKLEGEVRMSESWRDSDGSFIAANHEQPKESSSLKPVKTEEVLIAEKVCLKIGLKRARNGLWEVNGHRSSGIISNMAPKRSTPISQSSSAASSNDDNPVLNQMPNKRVCNYRRQEPVFNFDMNEQNFTWGGNEVESLDQQPLKGPEVIVLSDSEEVMANDLNLGYYGAMSENSGQNGILSLHPQLLVEEPLSGSFSFATENPEHPCNETLELQPQLLHTPLDFFAPSGNEAAQVLDINNPWPAQSHFEFLSVASDTSHPIHSDPRQPVSHQFFGSSSVEERMNNGAQELQYKISDASHDGSLVSEHNSRTLTTADPSLAMFWSPQPAVQPSIQRTSAVNGGIRDDWFSLSVGGCEDLLGSENVILASNAHDVSTEERGHLDSLATSLQLELSRNVS